MQRGFLYECFPDQQQKDYIHQACGCCRKVWNYLLGQILDGLKASTITLETLLDKTYWGGLSVTLGRKKGDVQQQFPFLTEISQQALNSTFQDLRDAFVGRRGFARYALYRQKEGLPMLTTRSFRNRKWRKKDLEATWTDYIGFPRFKKKGETGSFSNQNNTPATRNDGSLPPLQNRLEMTKPGWGLVSTIKLKDVLTRVHRPLPKEGRIGFATFTITPSGRYYVSLTVTEDIEPPAPILKTEQNTLRLTGLGHTPSPYWLMRLERIKILDKKLCKKRTTNPNWRESKKYKLVQLQRAKIWEGFVAAKKDALHKSSRSTADDWCHVEVQKTDRKKQQKSGDRAVITGSPGLHARLLTYKLKDQGGSFEEIAKEAIGGEK